MTLDGNVLDLLASFIVESAGATFVCIRRTVSTEPLVIFSDKGGAEYAVPLFQLSAKAVQDELRGAR